MKSNLLNNLPVLAVMASFLLVPVSTTAACMAFTFTGVVAMLVADYGREIEPLTAQAEIIAFRANGQSRALEAA
jgi:hypothetical protein